MENKTTNDSLSWKAVLITLLIAVGVIVLLNYLPIKYSLDANLVLKPQVTITVVDDESIIQVRRLWVENYYSSSIYYVVTEDGRVFDTDVKNWLLFEEGKCYRFTSYYSKMKKVDCPQ